MIKEKYERMLRKFGPDDPGTKNALRQLKQREAEIQGRQADAASKGQKVVIQAFRERPTLPQTPPSTKPPEAPAQT